MTAAPPAAAPGDDGDETRPVARAPQGVGPSPLDVPCTHCSTRPGTPCERPDGRRAATAHKARIDRYAAQQRPPRPLLDVDPDSAALASTDWPAQRSAHDPRDLAAALVSAVCHGEPDVVVMLHEVCAEPQAVLRLAQLVLDLLAQHGERAGISPAEALRRLLLDHQARRL